MAGFNSVRAPNDTVATLTQDDTNAGEPANAVSLQGMLKFHTHKRLGADKRKPRRRIVFQDTASGAYRLFRVF